MGVAEKRPEEENSSLQGGRHREGRAATSPSQRQCSLSLLCPHPDSTLPEEWTALTSPAFLPSRCLSPSFSLLCMCACFNVWSVCGRGLWVVLLQVQS